MPVVVMVVGKHGKDFLADEKSGLAVREFSVISGSAAQMRRTRRRCFSLVADWSFFIG